jgi:YVTN family beta-propeller protein
MRRTLFVSLAVLPCLAAADSHVVVANSGDGTVSIYSPTVITNGDPGLKLLKVVPVGKTPNEACISPDGKRAFVSNRGDTTVSVIDLDGMAVNSTITDPAMKNPDGCLVNRDGSKLYIAAAGAESVFIFSTSDGHKLGQIKTGQEPRRLLLSADESQLYVSNGDERYVSVIDCKTNRETGRIKAGRDNRSMILSPEGNYLAISNVSDDTVQFVRLGESEPEFVVGVPRSPQRLLAYTPREILFVIGRYDNVLAMADLRQTKEYGRFLSATIPVGRAPWGMALSAAGDCLYVTNTADGTLSIVDLRLMRVGTTIPTGKSPLGVAAR